MRRSPRSACLFATSNVHEGWAEPGDDGLIEFSEKLLGGHAFAIVGYDKQRVLDPELVGR